MEYDPVKDRLGNLFGRWPWLQLLFFSCLHVLLLRAWHVRRAVRSILHDKPQPIRVLDAGTGFGQYAWFVARTFRGCKVVAVDIKEDYLARAHTLFERRAPNINVAYDDLTQLKAAGPFDCILAVDVLEHIECDDDVLQNFSRVLSPGGSVVISTPSDLGGSDVHGDKTHSFIGEHVRNGYNKQDLEAQLEDAGLSITESCYTYGPFGAAAWRLLMKIPLHALNISWGFILLLPFYYLLVIPIGLLLHFLDTQGENSHGTGLLVVAQKLKDRGC